MNNLIPSLDTGLYAKKQTNSDKLKSDLEQKKAEINDKNETSVNPFDNLLNFASQLKDKVYPEAKEVLNLLNGIYESDEVSLNSEIEEFKIGCRRDCWLLAGLKAMSASDHGKQLIKDSITLTKDSAKVYFKGVDYTSEIPYDKIIEAKNSGRYSTGDDDVLLMELAFEDVFTKARNGECSVPYYVLTNINDSNDVLTSGYMQDFTYMLTGDLAWEQLSPYAGGFYDPATDTQYYYGCNTDVYGDRVGKNIEYGLNLKENNPEHVAVCVSMHSEVTAGAFHAYAVESVNGDEITIVNPSDTSDVRHFTRSQFYANILDMEYVEI